MINPQQQINIDLTQVENITCDECKGEFFSPTFIIKKISALMSPAGKETLAPMQIFQCANCSHVNELFLEGLTN